MGSLFESSSSTKSTQKTDVPKNYQTGLNNLLDMAGSAANNPYQYYTDQRVAGFDPASQQALDALSANQSAYDPLLRQVTNSAQTL